jgi:hypothetical protein
VERRHSTERGRNIVLEAAYVGSRSVNPARTIAANHSDRAAAVVVNRVPIRRSGLTEIRRLQCGLFDATANYNSLQVSQPPLHLRPELGCELYASKNIDTASAVADSFQIPWQFANIERGSPRSTGRRCSLGSVYEVPVGKGSAPERQPVRLRHSGRLPGQRRAHASSGQPLNITQNNTNTILSAQRPDVIDPRT